MTTALQVIGLVVGCLNLIAFAFGAFRVGKVWGRVLLLVEQHDTKLTAQDVRIRELEADKAARDSTVNPRVLLS